MPCTLRQLKEKRYFDIVLFNNISNFTTLTNSPITETDLKQLLNEINNCSNSYYYKIAQKYKYYTIFDKRNDVDFKRFCLTNYTINKNFNIQLKLDFYNNM